MSIEPGPELDLRVAKALGLNEPHLAAGLCWIQNPDPVEREKPLGWNIQFRPSTDLKDAFWAAEKVKEFLREYVIYLRGWNRDGSGTVTAHIAPIREYGDGTLGDEIASARTVALAICAAILKLKEP